MPAPAARHAKTSPHFADVVLADPNSLMLAALAEYFEADPRFSLLATTRSAEGFLEIVSHAQAHVAVIDWSLPLMGGAKLLEILRTRASAPRVVVYGLEQGTSIARHAMASGAAGFCSRDDPPERLLDVVDEVAQGRMVFPFLDVRELGRNPLDTLTQRERRLVEMLAQGLSNKELARNLDISLNTVKFHLRNIFEKLAVRSRTQAVALYYASGEASPPANERE
jgi:DNA-binding NarL/FixJ family response regulator